MNSKNILVVLVFALFHPLVGAQSMADNWRSIGSQGGLYSSCFGDNSIAQKLDRLAAAPCFSSAWKPFLLEGYKRGLVENMVFSVQEREWFYEDCESVKRSRVEGARQFHINVEKMTEQCRQQR